MIRGVLLFLVGVLVGANVVYFVMSRRAPVPGDLGLRSVPVEPLSESGVPSPTLEPGVGRIVADPSKPPAVVTDPEQSRADLDAARGARHDDGAAPSAGQLQLIVPVRGVTRNQLSNTYEDARGSGRVHEAIDIMADLGTPVVAVADGRIEKLFTSDLGGLTIYQFEPSGRYAYYYAHLDRYADGLDEGDVLKQGDVVGYVGSSGNASDDAPHLHFGIFELTPERQWWKGTAINPYPVLMGEAPRRTHTSR